MSVRARRKAIRTQSGGRAVGSGDPTAKPTATPASRLAAIPADPGSGRPSCSRCRVPPSATADGGRRGQTHAAHSARVRWMLWRESCYGCDSSVAITWTSPTRTRKPTKPRQLIGRSVCCPPAGVPCGVGMVTGLLSCLAEALPQSKLRRGAPSCDRPSTRPRSRSGPERSRRPSPQNPNTAPPALLTSWVAAYALVYSATIVHRNRDYERSPIMNGSRVISQADRRRATSASATAAATDAFSDSTSDIIGIDTRRSHVSPTSRDSPRPSDPTTITSGPTAASSS